MLESKGDLHNELYIAQHYTDWHYDILQDLLHFFAEYIKDRCYKWGQISSIFVKVAVP